MKITLIIIFIAISCSVYSEIFALRASALTPGSDYYVIEFFEIDTDSTAVTEALENKGSQHLGTELSKNRSNGNVVIDDKNFVFDANVFLVKEGSFLQKFKKNREQDDKLLSDVTFSGTLKIFTKDKDDYIALEKFEYEPESPLDDRTRIGGAHIIKLDDTVFLFFGNDKRGNNG